MGNAAGSPGGKPIGREGGIPAGRELGNGPGAEWGMGPGVGDGVWCKFGELLLEVVFKGGAMEGRLLPSPVTETGA